MQVDLVIATYNRAHELGNTLENVLQFKSHLNQIIVVDNHSTDNTQNLLEKYDDEKIYTIRNNSNLGASGGKNVGLRHSDADIIIVLDDDAIFDSADPIVSVRSFFNSNLDVGIVQFKIVNYHKRVILGYEFPGKQPEVNGDLQFETSYFVGAGHAIRKKMLEDVGYYPDDFFYGHEEIDLSYRAIDAGYKIVYFPGVSVLHKKDPAGRLPPKDVSRHLLANRLIMNWRYLPLLIALANSILWTIKVMVSTRSVVMPVRAVMDFLRRRPHVSRRVLTFRTLAYMRGHNGRLFK